MPTLLHVDASEEDAHSLLRHLSGRFRDEWPEKRPDWRYLYRDLSREPVPPVDTAWARAAYLAEKDRSPEQRAVLELSDLLVDELIEAERYAFFAPLFNLTLPAGFTAYIDQTVRLGRTYIFDKDRFRGLLTGKKALVITAREGHYEPMPWDQYDNYIPYLRDVFGLMGLTDIQFIQAEGGKLSTRAIEESLDDAMAAIHDALAKW